MVHPFGKWLRAKAARAAGTAAAAIAVLSLTVAAQAAPFNVNLVGSPQAVAGGFQFNYELVLAQTEAFEAGDYFTVYDFAGFTGVSAAPAGWSFQSLPSGVTPASQLVTENPVTPNLTVTYHGAGSLGAGTYTGFSAVSNVGGVQPGKFSIKGTDNGQIKGVFEGNGVAGVPVPEPGTMTLLGMAGLMGAGAAFRRGRRSGSAA